MTKEDKAKAIVNLITGHAPWKDWNGISRSNIEQSIANGISEYAKQQAIAFANYVMKEYTKALCSDSPMLSDEDIYAQFIEQQNK